MADHSEKLHSWQAIQAIGILAVDNIRPSACGMALLRQNAAGKLSYEQGLEAIRQKARALAAKDKAGIAGKIVAEGVTLPGETPDTILVRDNEETVRLPTPLEAELIAALDEADREPGIAANELLERLRRFG